MLELDEVHDTWGTLRFRNEHFPPLWWDILTYLDGQQQSLSQMKFVANGLPAMNLYGNGDLFVYGDLFELSDSTVKENIQSLHGALSGIQKIRAVTYNWKDRKSKGDTNHIGFLAQEVEQAFPQLVNTDENGEKTISYTHMVPVLLEAIKEQQVEIDALTAKQSEMDVMKAKMDQMEVRLASLLEGKE